MAKKIIKLLNEIKNEKKITVLISEHRLDLILPFADTIMLMKNGFLIEYDLSDKVINGTNFQNLKLNKPVIYSIFNELKEEKLFDSNIPKSITEAIRLLK